MAVTSATIGMGATFGIGNGVDGGSISWAKVGEVTNITVPGITREAIDATHLESPDDFREFIAGLLDTESATISFNYVPSATDALYTAALAKKGDFQIIYPNGIKMDFMGIVTGWKPGDASPTTMAGELTIKPTGKPLLT